MGRTVYDLRCATAGCAFTRRNIISKDDARRHAKNHAAGFHKVDLVEKEPLSNTVRVRDRIKLKEDAVPEYRRACEAAGFEPAALAALTGIKVVTRIDQFGTGGRPRLFFEGPPFAFYPSDVELAWNSDDERRKALGVR